MTKEIIREVVCEEYGCPQYYIDENSNYPEIVRPRQLCQYFAMKYALGSLAKVGMFYGKKDHATVLHSIKVINNEVETNSKFRVVFKRIQSRLAAIEVTEVIKVNNDASDYAYDYPSVEISAASLAFQCPKTASHALAEN